MNFVESNGAAPETPRQTPPERDDSTFVTGFKQVVGWVLGVHTTMLGIGVFELIAWHAGTIRAVPIVGWPLGPILALSAPIVAILAFVTFHRAFVITGVANLLLAAVWCALMFAALCQL